MMDDASPRSRCFEHWRRHFEPKENWRQLRRILLGKARSANWTKEDSGRDGTDDEDRKRHNAFVEKATRSLLGADVESAVDVDDVDIALRSMALDNVRHRHSCNACGAERPRCEPEAGADES